MKNIKLLSLLTLLPAALAAQESEFLSTGIYDAGRLRTNTAIDFHSFNQWNGVGNNPANVGWNSDGIWWGFVRFGSGASTHTNPGLYNKLVAADQINLHLGVLWLEVDSALVGIVAPGVPVGLYLVPGFAIPDGSLPTFPNAWPFNYPDRIKLAEINPATVKTVRSTYNEWQFNPATIAERQANLVPYDITAGIKQAISQGLLTDTTSWGVVFMNEDALPALTPNNPAWADRRGTVMDARYIQLELVTGLAVPQWAGYDVDESGNVDTHDWMGFLNVAHGDWVYSYKLGQYIYLPEAFVSEAGAWTYLIR